VVFFKLQLVMFFEGIRSERQLIAAGAQVASQLCSFLSLSSVVLAGENP
jgi:hypothetical protein